MNISKQFNSFSKVDTAILASIATTIFAISVYLIAEKANYLENISNKYINSQNSEKYKFNHIIFYKDLFASSEIERVSKINKYIENTNPRSIGKMVYDLQSDTMPKSAHDYAMIISEIAGNHYRNKGMLYTAAVGHLNGKVVEQDLDHARKILELPLLQNDVRTDYYLGIWWNEKRNPIRDDEKARFHLERAATQGHAGAMRALKTIRVSTP